jgi:hypothetical protein
VLQDRRGWPIGWWFEGLTDASIVVGSEPEWLGFPHERELAATADAVMSSTLSPQDAAALARQENIGFVVIEKEDWLGWRRWIQGTTAPAFRIVFDNDEFLVLRVGS